MHCSWSLLHEALLNASILGMLRIFALNRLVVDFSYGRRKTKVINKLPTSLYLVFVFSALYLAMFELMGGICEACGALSSKYKTPLTMGSP